MKTKFKLMLPSIITAIIGIIGATIIDAQEFWRFDLKVDWFKVFIYLFVISIGIIVGIQRAFGKTEETPPW